MKMKVLNLSFSAIWLLLASVVITSCYNDLANSPEEINIDEANFAVPLVSTKIKVVNLTDELGQSSKVSIDNQGRMTLYYSGELYRQTKSDIIPAIPGFVNYQLIDSVTSFPLPISPKHKAVRGIFKGTNAFFSFTHSKAEKITMTIKIPTIKENNGIYSRTFTLDFTAPNQTLSSGALSLDGLEMDLSSKMLPIIYEAIDSQGQRIKLDNGLLNFDVLDFTYVEGNFGNMAFTLEAGEISIGLFDKWISGGLEIKDPKVNIYVENSFGFPVRSKVNLLNFNTVNGGVFNLESSYINTGIDFAYPNINEVGQTKTTTFTFNGTNSNIGQIFADKPVKVLYQLDAIPNPDDTETLTNFLVTDSYFSIGVDVELPLQLKTNQFTIADTFDISLNTAENIRSAELKSVLANDYPMDMKVQAYFLDNTNTVIDSLFKPSSLLLKAATVGADGKTIPGEEVINYHPISEDNVGNINRATKILVVSSFDSSTISSDFHWVYSDYAITFRLGAKLLLKN